ncbi:hypothetical protein CPB85DRAFT_1435527 [Mucidula mucida]|nr:hypothetical protein CPB85DRAFT_1435527 [Mucidula mucida]
MRGHDRSADRTAIPLYHAHPPPWLPPAHISAELGYAGYHPPRVHQEEDVLSDANVKNGFALPLSVSLETSTAQPGVSEALHGANTLAKLEELMNQVFARRSQQLPPIPSCSFRVPPRVTLNDPKRQNWFADLANPAVPLNKLGKSVPHGAKGHDLLDLLQFNNVAIPRAVWFLRVFGANETAGLRNKPSYNPSTDIALPSAPRPGMNIKQTFKGVLADSATRERWILRFSYCLKLLQSFYLEGLVDHRTFLIWVVHHMSTCNLAQAGFIARIADEYLEGMLACRPLSKHFVDACVGKLSEISLSASKEFLVDTEGLLKVIVQRICLALPDAFVSPKQWQLHSKLLDNVLAENIMDPTLASQNTLAIRQILARHCSDIQRRNQAMLFSNLPPLATARLGSSVLDIKLLNSISKTTNINSISFFSDDLEDTKHKLDLLLTWCITPLQFGDHRPFAAVTLIYNWRQRASARSIRRECTSPDEFLQDELFTWLDCSDVAGDPKVIRTVSLLFGKLVQRQLFSYERYIQRLVARSEPGLIVSDPGESRHRHFLRWITLTEKSHIAQRKTALYGVRIRDVPEEQNEREMRREIRAVLPIFEGSSTDVLRSPSALVATCPKFMEASRYEQVRTLKLWLLPLLQKRLSNAESSGDQSVLKSYCLTVELMAKTKSHSLSAGTLLNADSLNTAIDIIRRFATIWACMDAVNTILATLQTAHQSWKSRGVQSRALLLLIVELDNNALLSREARDQIQTDASIYALALQPLMVNQAPVAVPDVLPEILLLAGDFDPQAPSTLANGLWIKYRMSYDWAWKVWDNTVASLRQIPAMTPEESGRRDCALRYAHFLCHIDQHLPSGLDDEVLRWFLGPGKHEVAMLSPETWDIATVLLLFLVVRGALKTTTIMTGLVYPAWQLGASASTPQQASQMELFLAAANNLVKVLLLCEEGTAAAMPPADIFDIQRLRTRKQDVYCDPHFPVLVTNIPIIVSLENNELIPETLRAEVKTIRHCLYEDNNFRQGTFRNLDALRTAFEHAMNLLENTSPEVGDRTMAALRMIFSEAPEEDIEIYSWPEKSSFLSPWMISATTIQLQFFLKQMEHSVSTESHAYETACMTLDKLTAVIFDHSLSSDEASFVTQMTQGVGSAVAGKIINNGLRFLTETIGKDTTDAGVIEDCATRAGESFRILIYVAEPLRQDPSQLPSLNPEIQDAFFSTLCAKFNKVDAESKELDDSRRESFTRRVILLARLLQFDLGFDGAWTPSTTSQCRGLSQALYRLALFHASGSNFDSIVFPLLLDTLLFLVDEMPATSKMAAFDPFAAYPPMDASALTTDIPPEYLRQLRSLLPSLPNVARVANLASCRRDQSGQVVQETPVVNDHGSGSSISESRRISMQKRPNGKGGKAAPQSEIPRKNTGSLSLDTFGARMTGDGILETRTDDPVIEGNLRTFEDGLSSDSISSGIGGRRGWRLAPRPRRTKAERPRERS